MGYLWGCLRVALVKTLLWSGHPSLSPVLPLALHAHPAPLSFTLSWHSAHWSHSWRSWEYSRNPVVPTVEAFGHSRYGQQGAGNTQGMLLDARVEQGRGWGWDWDPSLAAQGLTLASAPQGEINTKRQDPVETEDLPGHNTAAPVQETLHGCQPVTQEDGKESRIAVQEHQ